MRRTAWVWLVALGVAGTTAGWAEPPEILCANVLVRAGDGAAELSRRAEFSAQEVADLVFGVQPVGRLTGEHVVTLKVYTPQGHLYHRIDVPVNADGGPGKGPQGPATRRLPGYPYPLPVVTPVEVPSSSGGAGGQQEVQVRFPVAGTTIVSSGLYGTWQVEAYWDGSRTPCRKAVGFRIVP